MKMGKWAELSGERKPKEIYHKVRSYEHSKFINEHVDYNIVCDIDIYTDGSREIEIIYEYMTLYDDNGNVGSMLQCKLPKKDRDEMIDTAKNATY